LRFTFVVAAYLVSTPLSSGFARLASGAFYFAILILTFYEIIIFGFSENYPLLADDFEVGFSGGPQRRDLPSQWLVRDVDSYGA
jgi:hypothetical protein